VQQHCATFFEQAEAAAGADLPQFVKDEFDAAEAFARRAGPGGEHLVEAPESCPWRTAGVVGSLSSTAGDPDMALLRHAL